ncbi:HNH endonuclease signature motif containing protein [Halalkalibacter krulwichiae]|uniref:HNH nuclease domain-containing protein n=1 Tax=Halalkalibacter krulwichiae TaxID=199441 RepID=A0A1X9M853_9BACI|nr:HNH endonuclease signature motif containing protein [Halalkalibacter krulwichiae]ARK28770.1 hypothetical protein BkAM31D_02285 [Halalkalibacter krulwichiae]
MGKQCRVDGCYKDVVGLGYCSMHYTRLKRYNDPLFPGLNGGNRPKKIKFKEVEGCFVLTSHKLNSGGYSEIRIRGITKKVHRHVYEQCFGEIPEGLVVRHKCDNPSCVNPEHLEIGTQKDNVRDMMLRNRHVKGSKKSASKLKETDVINIKRLLKKGCTNVYIASLYKVHNSVISEIKHKKIWTHVEVVN